MYYFILSYITYRYVRSQAVPWLTHNCRPLTAHVRLSCEVGVCAYCGGQCVTRTEDFPSTSVSTVSIIPSLFHTHLHLHVALSRRTNGRSLGTSKKQCSFGIGKPRIESAVTRVVWEEFSSGTVA